MFITFIQKLICCIDGAVILACAVTAFMNWWEAHPVVEENEPPFYITRTYKEIKNDYN